MMRASSGLLQLLLWASWSGVTGSGRPYSLTLAPLTLQPGMLFAFGCAGPEDPVLLENFTNWLLGVGDVEPRGGTGGRAAVALTLGPGDAALLHYKATVDPNARVKSDDAQAEGSLLAAIDTARSKAVAPRLGVAHKAAKPLFEQDRPWEPRIDNGYPSIIYQPDVPRGTAQWKLFYDAYTTGAVGCSFARTAPFANTPPPCESEASLYAESKDGLSSWTKPNLGICPWPPGATPTKNATDNNIFKCPWHDGTFENPVSVFRDDGPSAPRAAAGQPSVLTSFGMWGAKPTDSREGNCGWDGYVARSWTSGRTWVNRTRLLTEDPNCRGGTRFDTQTPMFYDRRTGTYVATTRASRDAKCGGWVPKDLCDSACNCSEPGAQRAIAISQSPNADLFDGSQRWQSWRASVGTPQHQLYTGITWPWAGIYLQMVMVYDATSNATEQRVHCKLQWSQDLHRWSLIEPSKDLIPLGPSGTFDSHIIFSASGVYSMPEGERVYYMGGNGPHYGPRNSSLGLATFRPSGFAGIGLASDTTIGTLATTTLTAGGSRLLLSADIAVGGVLSVSRCCMWRTCNETVHVKAGALTRSPLPFSGRFAVGEHFTLVFKLEGATTVLYTLGYE